MRGIVALVFVAAAIPVASQQDIPRFRGGIDVVQFTVTVLDKDRHSVTGLTAADFEVLVDRKPRPIAAFAAVTLPGDTSTAITAAPLVAPDVQTNQLPPEGRLVVIVIDRSTPSGQPMLAARAVANAAIDRLGPADLGAVVFTAAGLLKHSQGITADRARLRAAVAEALGGALQEPPLPPTLAGAIAARGAPQPSQPLNRVGLASEELSGECICGLCVPDALTELAKQLSSPLMRHKYEVRAAVATADGTRAASVIGYVNVPDVRKTGLALSGVVVKSAGRPTLQRVFAAGEPVALAFQLARANDAPPNVTLRYVLTDALGQTLASVGVPPATRVRNGVGNYDLTARMPGQSGRYVAAIEASGGRHAERREVLFTVR